MWLPPKFPRRDLVALKYILYFLSAAGLFSIPSEKRVSFYEIIYNFYYVVVMSFITMVTIFTGLSLFSYVKDVNVLADHGVIFISLVLIMIKQNSMVRHKRLIEIWVAELERRYKSANEIERIRFTDNDKETIYYVKMFSCIWFLLTASYILPLYLRLPDDFQLPTIHAEFFGVDSVVKYYFIYAWNTVSLSLAILGVFAVDFFMVRIYSHAATRLQTLSDTLENLGHDYFGCNEYRKTMKMCDVCRSSVRRLIKKSVTEHCDIFKLVRELNHVFYWTLLVQSVFVAVIVAGCGFNGFISILHGNISSFVKSIMYIFGAICENWFYCKFGDRLKWASLNVAKALWNSHWYTLAREDRLSVLLITRASEKPLYMAAGKIFRMDLERFGFILSSAYSYFTVLQNFA